MTKGIDLKGIRSSLLDELAEKRSNETAATSREDTVARGDKMLHLVRQKSVIDYASFNDQTDFDIDVAPGVIWDDLNTFKAEHCNNLNIETIDGKGFKLTLPANEEEGTDELCVKVKFFQTSKEAD